MRNSAKMPAIAILMILLSGIKILIIVGKERDKMMMC